MRYFYTKFLDTLHGNNVHMIIKQIFYFYTHFLEEDLPNDYRIEFKAIFAYWKLKEIQLIEFDAYPNNKRKDFQEENKAKEEARKIYVKTLKYKIINKKRPIWK